MGSTAYGFLDSCIRNRAATSTLVNEGSTPWNIKIRCQRVTPGANANLRDNHGWVKCKVTKSMNWTVTECSAKLNVVISKILKEAGWCEKEMARNESHLIAFGCVIPQRHQPPFPQSFDTGTCHLKYATSCMT